MDFGKHARATMNSRLTTSSIPALVFLLALSACGGGGGGGGGGKAPAAGAKPPPVADDDRQAPSLVITSPGNFDSLIVGSTAVDLAGVALDNHAVAEVSWSTNLGAQGVAEGTSDWSARRIPLNSDITTVSVTARDASGNRTSRFIQISRDPEAVADNTAPTLSGRPDSQAVAGEPWSFKPAAGDADGDHARIRGSGTAPVARI